MVAIAIIFAAVCGSNYICFFSFAISSCFVRAIWLAACLNACNLLTPPLFIRCSVFQLNSRAGFFGDFIFKWLHGEGASEMAEHSRHICLLCLVTLQGEDGDTHFLHLMCLLLQPMPSVNMQLLDSHFSFGASSWVELVRAFAYSLLWPALCCFYRMASL